jgi:hypothetical protein
LCVAPLKLQRTVHAKLVLDRKSKRETIEREYNAWQRELQGRNEQLYSATKQQAERFKQRVRKQNGHGLKVREYPTILRRDCVKLQEQGNSMFRWWIRIPVYPKSIWTPFFSTDDLRLQLGKAAVHELQQIQRVPCLVQGARRECSRCQPSSLSCR